MRVLPRRPRLLLLPLLLGALPLLFAVRAVRAVSPASPSDSLPTCPDGDAAAIPSQQTTHLHAKLRNLLTNSTFFSLFSVALEKPCPFWQDDPPVCLIRDCSVQSCPDDQIPSVWRSPCPAPSDDVPSSHRHRSLNLVDRSLTPLAALVAPPPCLAVDTTAWTTRDDDDLCVFVDLRRNPERFTGYDGPSARRIWDAIYSENCFTFSAKCSSGICLPDACKEERVLYRLISGLQSSINMHIAMQYLHPGDRWAHNLAIYKTRIRPFQHRIDNLRLAYAVVLRAVAKAAPSLQPSSYHYTTGDPDNDHFTRHALQSLFQHRLLNPTCEQKVFDESDMFLRDNQHLLPEFRNAFRNISMIMDCVGCEKCRLWGKLQFLGLGTAMRILFERNMPQFQRNDIIALVNLLFKLSSSVLAVEEMERKVRAQARMVAKGGAAIAILCILIASLAIHNANNSHKSKPNPPPPKPRVRSRSRARAD